MRIVGKKVVKRAIKRSIGRNHRPISLAEGALTRLFGEGNESAIDGGSVSDQEIILADMDLCPERYPHVNNSTSVKKPKRKGPNTKRIP